MSEDKVIKLVDVDGDVWTMDESGDFTNPASYEAQTLEQIERWYGPLNVLRTEETEEKPNRQYEDSDGDVWTLDESGDFISPASYVTHTFEYLERYYGPLKELKTEEATYPTENPEIHEGDTVQITLKGTVLKAATGQGEHLIEVSSPGGNFPQWFKVGLDIRVLASAKPVIPEDPERSVMTAKGLVLKYHPSAELYHGAYTWEDLYNAYAPLYVVEAGEEVR